MWIGLQPASLLSTVARSSREPVLDTAHEHKLRNHTITAQHCTHNTNNSKPVWHTRSGVNGTTLLRCTTWHPHPLENLQMSTRACATADATLGYGFQPKVHVHRVKTTLLQSPLTSSPHGVLLHVFMLETVPHARPSRCAAACSASSSGLIQQQSLIMVQTT